MNVRKLCPEDIEAVVALANQAWRPIMAMSRAALGDKISDRVRKGGDDRCKGIQVRAEIDAHPEWYFVCEHEGRIVGFCGVFLNYENKVGTIGHNAADKTSGLKGIGQMLYKAALDFFRAEGMEAATVFTGLDDAHAPARRAYERAGFDRSLKHVTYWMEL